MLSKTKGISLAEIIISTFALAILMLGFSQFSADMFDVSASHATQITNVNQARFATERIITQISKAAYIYPANINIKLSDSLTISTTTSVAMLIPADDGNYNLIAYYMVNNASGKSDLYEYISSRTYAWAQNTCPATNLLNFSGSSSLLANNTDKISTTLQYILNYSNAPYDTNLKGAIANVTTSDTSALIKGINWNISQGTSQIQIIQLKGISRNVPRFLE